MIQFMLSFAEIYGQGAYDFSSYHFMQSIRELNIILFSFKTVWNEFHWKVIAYFYVNF